jgi:hypothetical protein
MEKALPVWLLIAFYPIPKNLGWHLRPVGRLPNLVEREPTGGRKKKE